MAYVCMYVCMYVCSNLHFMYFNTPVSDFYVGLVPFHLGRECTIFYKKCQAKKCYFGLNEHCKNITS